MVKANETTEPTAAMTTISVTSATGNRIRDMADERGLRIHRLPELLLEGWAMLSEPQRTKAMQRVLERSRRRQPVPA